MDVLLALLAEQSRELARLREENTALKQELVKRIVPPPDHITEKFSKLRQSSGEMTRTQFVNAAFESIHKCKPGKGAADRYFDIYLKLIEAHVTVKGQKIVGVGLV